MPDEKGNIKGASIPRLWSDPPIPRCPKCGSKRPAFRYPECSQDPDDFHKR